MSRTSFWKGCYIPFDFAKDFDPEYLEEIRYVCLVMTEDYIRAHFEDIRRDASVAEQRLDDSGLSMEALIRDNRASLAGCEAFGCRYVLIGDAYPEEIDL